MSCISVSRFSASPPHSRKMRPPRLVATGSEGKDRLTSGLSPLLRGRGQADHHVAHPQTTSGDEVFASAGVWVGLGIIGLIIWIAIRVLAGTCGSPEGA